MLKVEKVDENNKQRVIGHAKHDIIKHVFALYDIQYDPERTIAHACFEGDILRGYILTYSGADVPSIILECEDVVTAKVLLDYALQDHFVMHAPPNLLPAIHGKSPREKHYVENWMLVRKREANYFKSRLVKRLHTEDDALKLAGLLQSREDRPRRMLEKYFEWVSRMPLYGVFDKGNLVSYAGSFIQLPQLWMIGGVYTDPKQRHKGCATLATSAITEEALKHSEAAALFVRSDNHPAIKVYEKVGYKRIGEKLWVDVGTDLKP